MKVSGELGVTAITRSSGPSSDCWTCPCARCEDNARLARVFVRLARKGSSRRDTSRPRRSWKLRRRDLASHGVRAVEPGLAIDEIISEPLVVTLEGAVDDPKAYGPAPGRAEPPARMGRRQDGAVRRVRRRSRGGALAPRDGTRGAGGRLKEPRRGQRRRAVSEPSASIGLIGGSGLYALAGLTGRSRASTVSTPFGPPSGRRCSSARLDDRIVALPGAPRTRATASSPARSTTRAEHLRDEGAGRRAHLVRVRGRIDERRGSIRATSSFPISSS